MISLKILDVKSFMSNLLIQEVFDAFLLVDLDISTFNNFHISGYINKSFYSEEELEALKEQEYSKWKQVKPIVFNLVKGNKTPLSFKIVFVASTNVLEKMIEESGIRINPGDVGGLFLNLKFELGVLNLITGTSFKTFTLDKSLEVQWDKYMKNYLTSLSIAYDEN